MVREGNDRSTDAKNHTGMNLAMRISLNESRFGPSRRLTPLELLTLLQVGDVHRYHGRLLFLDVEKFDQALLQSIVEVHAMLLPHLVNMVPAKDKTPLLVDDEEGALDAAGICVEPNLLVGYVSDDRDLFRDLKVPAQVLDGFDQIISVVMGPPPITIHEDFDVFASTDHRLRHLVYPLHSKVFKNTRHVSHRTPDTDKSHQRQILDQPASCSLGCLGRANHAPVGVVELAGFGEFASLGDRGIQPAQVRKGGGKSEAIEDLSHTCFLHISIPILTPIPSSQSRPQPISNNLRLQRLIQQHPIITIINILLQYLCHHISKIPKQLPKMIPQQTPRHIQPLFPIIISIILINQV